MALVKKEKKICCKENKTRRLKFRYKDECKGEIKPYRVGLSENFNKQESFYFSWLSLIERYKLDTSVG